jgi:glyoxylase-like metal-dependent hydrolase (beta-lactamase superfamily II)
VRLIDLEHLGNERVIGSWLVGDVLIDPGPETCLQTLLAGLAGERPRVIAITHIHLDHSGATGSLLRLMPELEVWVHERGAPHLADPERLLRSATRLYGEDMERLWGEVLPVPADRIKVLGGGERLDGFSVQYTPGHAYHHVSYLHEESGTAFCGDTAGVRIFDGTPVVAPTPPPDIDPPAWLESLAKIEAWRPSAIVPTHFGRYEDVSEHLRGMRESLTAMEELARGGEEAEYIAALRDRFGELEDETATVAYGQAMPPDQSYAGLRRYIEKAQAES